MTRENLSKDKQEEYDSLTSKIMQEIEEELNKIPEQQQGQLDGPRSKVYRDVTNKYLPELKRILGNNPDI